MMHAMVIGRAKDGAADDINEDIAMAVGQVHDSGVHVARAGSIVELLDVVADLRNQHGLLDVLDIVDHGRPGMQLLGSDVLFKSDADICSKLGGALTARAIAGHLAPLAHVRLLGCRVAADEDEDPTTATAGRILLYKIARALGGRRTVFGTLRGTNVGDFADVGYLSPVLEDEILFSSLAALDGDPPAYKARRINYGLLLGQRCP